VSAPVNHDWVLWILLTASAIHVVEERGLGWQGWAARVLAPRIGIAPSWPDFWATNGLLIVFGVSAAAVGWRAPAFAMAFPALALVNAVFFHVVPSVQARRPNPGLFTAVLLYLPIGIWSYVEASNDGVLDAGTVVGSVVIGALSMASVIGLLMLQPRFRYPDVDPAEADQVRISRRSPQP
jgi:Protein of unknown function with HXXEE motif